MSEIIKSELPEFGRYEVSSDGTVKNRATGNQMKEEQSGDRFFYRLTNDSGERVRVYTSQIEEHFAAIKPAKVEESISLKKPDLNYRENGKRKVTEDEVREIRKLASEGTKQADLAIMFDVHNSSISDIVKKKVHKNLK